MGTRGSFPGDRMSAS